MFKEEVISRIKVFEGYSEQPYVCPAGKWTVGFGYNYQDRGFTTEYLTEILQKGMTADIADRLLADDVCRVVLECEKTFAWYKALDDVRRATITDMCYQLGLRGLMQFKKMLSAIERKDYAAAATEAKNSRWYTQSGRRSGINVKQLESGKFQTYK